MVSRKDYVMEDEMVRLRARETVSRKASLMVSLMANSMVCWMVHQTV